MTPAFLYALAILAVLLAFAVIVAVNLRVLPTITDYKSLESGQPSVAVLVPARNEAANIEACLRSLLEQEYPNLQIWLYDDQSGDGTVEIARRVQTGDDRHPQAGPVPTTDGSAPAIRIVEGKEAPPAGWLGKAHALHRLCQAVKAECAPDYLLFVDADVRLEVGAVSHAVATAMSWRAGLFSIFPRQDLVGVAERLAVPVALHWTVYNFLPLPFAFTKLGGAPFAAANGQFMLFTREAYEACGGHESVRAQVLEDVALARAVKRAGYRAILADGGPTVHARMYRGGGEVWRGYSKNAFAFFGHNAFLLLIGIVVLLALYVLPPVLAGIAFAGGNVVLGALFLAQYLVAVQTRLMLSVRFAYPLLDNFLHPIAVLFLIAIEVNSAIWAATGKGKWKGRSTRA